MAQKLLQHHVLVRSRNRGVAPADLASTTEKQKYLGTQVLLRVEQIKCDSKKGEHSSARSKMRELFFDLIEPGRDLYDPPVTSFSRGELAGLWLLRALFQRQDGDMRAARASLGKAQGKLPGAFSAIHDDFEAARIDVEGSTDGKVAMDLSTEFLTSVNPGSKYFDCF